MINRRGFMGVAAGGATLAAAPALGQADWRQRFPQLTFAKIPDENASGVTERHAPLMAYLSREIGVPVTLRIANDYAAVIEGQRSGNIHIASYGPASFARAIMTGAEITAVAQEVNADGSTGYFSVFYVKADSPYQRIEDLRGKALGLVDPNSTSGNNVPRFALDRMGINPEQFFSRVVYTGSHENAIIALQQGTVDVAANWWNNERESNLLRMQSRNMARAQDFRIIFRSDEIVNSPVAVLNAMGPAARETIQRAFLELPQKDPAAWATYIGNPPSLSAYRATTNEAYNTIVELNRFVDTLRRRS